MNALPIAVVDLSTQQEHRFHSRLACFNQRRFKPTQPSVGWEQQLSRDLQTQIEEGEYIESERRAVQARLIEIPDDADGFMSWFETLRDHGPGQNDPLFPWLASFSSLEQMRWFLGQEVAGEAGFDDLVALTQVRFPTTPKLEMARNYWDEMGRGHEQGMHGAMLAATAREFDLDTSLKDTLWESLALANVMAALAANRRYAYHSIGALGAIEMTAPGRVSLVNEGLKRLGVSSSARQYFQLHAGLDIRHSEAWNKSVIYPLISSDFSCARSIAEGAVMRLRCGLRCFERYRAEFGI